MKAMVIFGTRPEAIKMCPLVLELKKRQIDTCLCLTGQHEEMLSQVMRCFEIQEDYNLHIMKQNQTLAEITSNVLTGIDHILDKEKPDIVLVHGDTTTSFAAGLACFYRNIKVAHVEAGLRTYNLNSPFPEELNRQMVDLFSGFYFAPTEVAKKNLLMESKNEDKIFVTGNTVIDALNTTIRDDYSSEDLEWAKGSKLILLTAHRRENLGEPMRNIFRAVRRIVEEYPVAKVIYPVHKNPLVRELAREELGTCENVRLIEPLDVLDFHNYMKRAYLILTDSGGIQEEAPALGKPVLVLRDTTERPEGVEAGTLKLVGTTSEIIYEETVRLIEDEDAYEKIAKATNPYGDGKASERIVTILESEL